MGIECIIEGCMKPAVKRGWCGMHYERWLRHGDPLVTLKGAVGSGYAAKSGYVVIGTNGTHKGEHILVAERALGRPLPKGVVVHHVDEDRSNNLSSNLVICPTRGYHSLLHIRMAALAACGNANWRKCKRCKKYDDPVNLNSYLTTKGGNEHRHRGCERQYRLAIYKQKRGST